MCGGGLSRLLQNFRRGTIARLTRVLSFSGSSQEGLVSEKELRRTLPAQYQEYMSCLQSQKREFDLRTQLQDIGNELQSVVILINPLDAALHVAVYNKSDAVCIIPRRTHTIAPGQFCVSFGDELQIQADGAEVQRLTCECAWRWNGVVPEPQVVDESQTAEMVPLGEVFAVFIRVAH